MISDKFFYHCIPYLSDHSYAFHEKSYLCDAYDGQRYLLSEDKYIDDSEVIRFAKTLPFIGGLGGSGAGSASQASAGSIGGTIGGGLLPFSVSGGVSHAQASSAAGAGAGGLGYFG